jgi:hypothetical protein
MIIILTLMVDGEEKKEATVAVYSTRPYIVRTSLLLISGSRSSYIG